MIIDIGTRRFVSISILLTFDFKLFLAMPESIKTAEADENASNVTNKAAVCKERHECIKAQKASKLK